MSLDLTEVNVGSGNWLVHHGNRPVVQIPQYTGHITHKAPFCNRNVHMYACTFLLQNGAMCGICLIHCVICEMGLFSIIRESRIYWYRLIILVPYLFSRGVSNHRQFDCILNILFGLKTKTHRGCALPALCEGNPPVSKQPLIGGFPLIKGRWYGKRSHVVMSIDMATSEECIPYNKHVVMYQNLFVKKIYA